MPPGDKVGFNSLNFVTCKNEADRINYENMRMASRLMTSQSALRPLTDKAVKEITKPKRINSGKSKLKYVKLEKRHKSRVANAFGHFTH